jgi:hypothetical protein
VAMQRVVKGKHMKHAGAALFINCNTCTPIRPRVPERSAAQCLQRMPLQQLPSLSKHSSCACFLLVPGDPACCGCSAAAACPNRQPC